jgi:predicted HTH transcriptional regulator
MQLFELHEIIEKGENGTIEFKRKFSSPEKIAKEMIAFANTKGGYLLFGIDDDRSVVGVESEKSEIELIEMAAKFYCEPEIEYKTDILPIYRKDVVIVEIPESRSKPHRLIENGKDDPYRVYIRVKDKSVLASKETVRVLRKSQPDAPPLILNMTDKEKALLDYLSVHEKITMKEFKEMLNISNRRASRILVNLVRAELIRQHNTDKEDFYTLS